MFEPWLYVCAWDKSQKYLKNEYVFQGDCDNENFDLWSGNINVPEFYKILGPYPRNNYMPQAQNPKKHIKKINEFYKSKNVIVYLDYNLDAVEHSSDLKFYNSPAEAFGAGRRYLYKKLMSYRKSNYRRDRSIYRWIGKKNNANRLQKPK